MLTNLVVVGVVLLVLAMWQRKAFMQIFNALGAQVGKLGRLVWGLDPIANYQAEVDRSAQEIQDASGGLEEYKGIVERYKRKKETGQKQEANLTALIKNAISSNDDAKASNYMIQLQEVRKTLAEDSKNLEDYEKSYENNLKKVKYARQRIDEVKEKARRLSAELNLSAVEANTAKLAGSLNLKLNSFEGLGQIEDEIQNKIDANRSKAAVARDLSADGLDELEEQESQKKVAAAEELAKMKAEMAQK